MEHDSRGQPNVLAAFDILLEEMDAEIDRIRREGARAFESGDLKAVSSGLRAVERLAALRKEVAAARDAWRTALSRGPRTRKQRNRGSGGAVGRLIPTEDYFLPILEALEQMGGSGRTADVVEKVRKAMTPRFTAADLAPIPSDTEEPRWHKSAQWARLAMKHRGLLRSDSPRGIWEISESGREFLERGGR